MAKLLDDLVTIGGGPIGCFAAMNALKYGIDPVVVEEHREPGLPEHCTGHVSIKGLEQLGLKIPENIIQKKVRRYRFLSPSGFTVTIQFQKPQTLILNRSAFDKWLADKFIDKGGLYLSNSKVIQIKPSNDKTWELKYIQNNRVYKKKTFVLIDSEGFPAHLLKTSNPIVPVKSEYIYAIQSWLDNIWDYENNSVDIYLSRRFAPGFYGWFASLPDGSAKVGLGSKFPQVKMYLDRFIQNHLIKKKLTNVTILRTKSHLIPMGGPLQKAWVNGLMITGDAASQVKQTTGGGLIPGLTSAKIAGETAAFSVQKQDSSAISRYNSLFMKKYKTSFRVMGVLRKFFNFLSDKRIDQIISKIDGNNTEIVIEEDMDFDRQVNLLYTSLRKPTLIAKILRTLLIKKE